MITFLKNLWFTLKFEKAPLLVAEHVGDVKELNGIYYAVLTNGLVYKIKHFNKFFNVIVFHKGVKISEFKYSSDAKKVDVSKKKQVDGESIMARINIKSALSQILCDTPFSRCDPKDFQTLAKTLKSQFTSDDYLSFFFKRDYPTIGLVEYKLSITHYTGSGHPSYSSRGILIMDGLIYEPTHDNKLAEISQSNMRFVDKYSAFVGPFFMSHQADLYLVYFDLKCVNIVHFVDEYTIEKKSVNYHNSERTVVTETVPFNNIHHYFGSIMYDLVKMKASEAFLERCEQCSINIEDPFTISNEEMELFKMATY
jgi:hypothetical protein